MVLGTDVGLEDTCILAICGLVGKLSYSYLAKNAMTEWTKLNWVPVLGYEPELLCLTKGWWGIIVKSPEDVDILLNNLCINGGSRLMIKIWRVAFNTKT